MVCAWRKGESPFAEAHVAATNRPSFGSSAIRPCIHLTRGFASPPHDGFALIGKGLRRLITERKDGAMRTG